MLDALRQAAGGTVSKILMGILVISFGIWGVAGRMVNDFGAATLARVGSQEITVPEFARAQEEYQSLAQQSGRQITPDQVLDQLLLSAALDDEAHRANLGVSEDHIAQSIAKDPRFHGQGGAFDRNVFQAVLQNSGLNRDDYVRNVRKNMVRQQIASSVGTGIAVPEPLVQALYRYQNEERTISFITVDAAAIDPVGTPDAKTLQAYFDENKEQFRAPEYRKLGLLVVDPSTLADPKAVKEEDVAAEYQRRKDFFTSPERRHVEQIRFATPDAAEQALKKAEAGTDFAALAKDAGMKPEDVDLGMKTEAEFLDPAIAKAAFAAKPNTVVPVLKDALQPSLIRVTEVAPGSVTALQEVAPRLRQDLATRAARSRVQDLFNQIEDERAGGSTLEEVGKKISVPYRVIPAVAADGTSPDGAKVELPAQAQLLKGAFDSDVGVDNNAIRAGDEGYVFYDVLETEPAHDRKLEEVRDRVVKAWQAQETETRIAEKTEALLGRLQKGEALAALAAEIGKPVQTDEHVKRGTSATGLSANAVAQAFAGPQGHVADADSDTPPARILLKVDLVTVPAYFAEASDAQAIKTQLADALRSDVLQSFNRQLLQSRSTSVDNNVFAQLTGASQSR
jgi:peptidyl-prolyl cis-trans isomerase D